MSSKENVRNALKAVKYPGFSRDIVSFGLVQNISVEGDRASVRLSVTTTDREIPVKIKEGVESVLKDLDGISSVAVEVDVETPQNTPGSGGQNSAQSLDGVKYILAVASGKGGVGKSTVSVNLACAIDDELRERGLTNGVGIMDCDIYGPSVPLMMGVGERPEIDGEKIRPPMNYGIKVMSMALLVDENAPVVWRGPMINNAIQQFVKNVHWSPLDVLVVDLPPGTGDAQLTLVQTLPVNGALIVTTPQVAAVQVARRGAKMFEKVEVPILGVCENMSWLEGPDGRKVNIFGEGGGAWTADQLETSLLAQIPLDPEIREGGDRGIPLVKSYPASNPAQAFRELAKQVLAELETRENI